MPYTVEPADKVESKIFPGVSMYVRIMTEGRRSQLRRETKASTSKIRESLREQGKLEKQMDRDKDNVDADDAMSRWQELVDDIERIRQEEITPLMLKWGVHAVEGLLDSKGNPLTIDQWQDWPSALVREAVSMIEQQVELDGVMAKNSGLPTTSGEQAEPAQKPSTADDAKEAAGGEIAVVDTTRVM